MSHFKTSRQNGFTLIEILVGMGIISVVSVLLSMSMANLSTSQAEFELKNEGLLFLNGLSSAFLGNQNFCDQAVLNKNVGLTGKEPMVITNYSGFAATGGPIQAGTLLSGTPTNQKLRIRSLMIEANPSVVDVDVMREGVTLKRKVARLTASVEYRRSSQGDFVPLKDWIVDFPVYTTAAGVMQSCSLAMEPADVCQMVGSTLAGNVCQPEFQCQVRGSYVTSSCSPGYSGCMSGVANPVTGAFSCPAGSTTTKTGDFSQTFNVSCGKKCSYNVTNTIRFYICMQCQ